MGDSGAAQRAEGTQRRASQIVVTAVPVACIDVGTYQAFHPAALSDHVVVAKADLAWLLSVISPETGCREEWKP